jgi:hypothetical protein
VLLGIDTVYFCRKIPLLEGNVLLLKGVQSAGWLDVQGASGNVFLI